MVSQLTDRPSPELEDELVRLVWARMDNPRDRKLRDPTLLPFLRESLPPLRRALEAADRALEVNHTSHLHAKAVRRTAGCVVA